MQTEEDGLKPSLSDAQSEKYQKRHNEYTLIVILRLDSSTSKIQRDRM